MSRVVENGMAHGVSLIYRFAKGLRVHGSVWEYAFTIVLRVCVGVVGVSTNVHLLCYVECGEMRKLD